MEAFAAWIQANTQTDKPIFVGFNACYDWQFVNWYFHTYLRRNPFGYGGIDIKSYFMGLSGRPWIKTTSSQLPTEFQPETPQTHNALDDAKAQASIFGRMLEHQRRASN
jgi:DNA polymerase III alpha subunit (gram-positive type)